MVQAGGGCGSLVWSMVRLVVGRTQRGDRLLVHQVVAVQVGVIRA